MLQVAVGNLVVDDRHSLLFCAIPKAGSTTWKHYLLQNRQPESYNPSEAENRIHNATLAAERGLPLLRLFNRSEILRRLNTHFKVLVVRHPLDRLISSYLEKFRGQNKHYKEHVGVRIIKEERENANSYSLTRGDDVTFDEFIRFIVHKQHVLDLLDWHWENYEKLCFPCAVEYDYIAKLETNAKDSEYIINKYLQGVNFDKGSVRNQNRNITHDTWGSGKELEQYNNITNLSYKQLLQFYQGDMDMFGYSAERERKGETVARCSERAQCC